MRVNSDLINRSRAREGKSLARTFSVNHRPFSNRKASKVCFSNKQFWFISIAIYLWTTAICCYSFGTVIWKSIISPFAKRVGLERVFVQRINWPFWRLLINIKINHFQRRKILILIRTKIKWSQCRRGRGKLSSAREPIIIMGLGDPENDWSLPLDFIAPTRRPRICCYYALSPLIFRRVHRDQLIILI